MGVGDRSPEGLSEPRFCETCDREARPREAEKGYWLQVRGPNRYDPNRPDTRHFCCWGCLAEYAELVK